jgi:predicted ATPase/class 3 adenylate cyclase
VEACPSCHKELPSEFPFCPFCGAELTETAPRTTEERKVVSVLFCDLVGFTAASEAADPEDVRARLRPYHVRVRLELERYGGTVEKFIGDAVMAVFGAPVSHEDDAERAVRAGLRILEAIEELNERDWSLRLRVRVGINTGEAVVDRDAKPERGEGIVTGDVVNTAARLQSLAPIGGVAVGEATYRLTERLFAYERLEPVTAKGKAKPLECWRPLSAHARVASDLTHTHRTVFVGRTAERDLLTGAFDQVVQESERRLVAVVGEPGIGKSRLSMELLQYVEAWPGLVRWRQGRCLPYGEGITFWALGEIVKAECGILDTDSPAVAREKLERAVPDCAADRAWLLARVGPLVGLASEPAPQEESFTAWRRFLEHLAADGPAVVVFEDLHWADSALLAFLEHLADATDAVPLLVLCTARHDLFEQHPEWAGGLRNATTISLAPLSNEETAELVTALLGGVLPPETQEQLLARAGGNPLYAEEFVRLLTDRGQLGEVVEVPDSVQALIAARLDTLSPDRKALLQDASVIGKVFWAGALVVMGERDPAGTERALHELARRELVRASRTSTMEHEVEYSFSHALVRDVCYGQITRAGRIERHREAVAWLEAKAGERVEDLADVLAYHYQTALELTVAVGGTDAVDQLRAGAIRYLALAGERALALNVDRAEQQLAATLALASEDHPDRATLLESWAKAAQQQDRLEEARAALEEALALRRTQDDNLATARVLTAQALVLQRLGNPRRQESIDEAIALLEGEPPGPELIAAYGRAANLCYVRGAALEAIDFADRALALAARLDLPEPTLAVGARGGARCDLGEREGIEEMRRALEFAIERGETRTAASNLQNMAAAAAFFGDRQTALDLLREGHEFCGQRGITEMALNLESNIAALLAELGRTEEALVALGSVADRLEAAGDIAFVAPRMNQIGMLVECGRHDDAPDPGEAIKAARESGATSLILGALIVGSALFVARGQLRLAKDLLLELERTPDIRSEPTYVAGLREMVRTALLLGDTELAERLVDGVEAMTPRHECALADCRAQFAEAGGNHSEAVSLYAEAVKRWRDDGSLPDLACSLLGQGRCLTALGDPRAEAPLAEARELFSSLGYRPRLAETEALLAQSPPAAS